MKRFGGSKEQEKVRGGRGLGGPALETLVFKGLGTEDERPASGAEVDSLKRHASS